MCLPSRRSGRRRANRVAWTGRLGTRSPPCVLRAVCQGRCTVASRNGHPNMTHRPHDEGDLLHIERRFASRRKPGADGVGGILATRSVQLGNTTALGVPLLFSMLAAAPSVLAVVRKSGHCHANPKDFHAVDSRPCGDCFDHRGLVGRTPRMHLRSSRRRRHNRKLSRRHSPGTSRMLPPRPNPSSRTRSHRFSTPPGPKSARPVPMASRSASPARAAERIRVFRSSARS